MRVSNLKEFCLFFASKLENGLSLFSSFETLDREFSQILSLHLKIKS